MKKAKQIKSYVLLLLCFLDFIKCSSDRSIKFGQFSFYRIDDVEGIELLRWEDQQNLRKYVDSGGGGDDGGLSSNKATCAPSECAIEVSQTSRATCRNCSQKIMKGEVDASFIKLPLP